MGRTIRDGRSCAEDDSVKVLVTGASGFVGRHVVARLLDQGHVVVASARDLERARTMDWFDNVEFIPCDLHEDFHPLLDVDADALIHLAWPGLPDYKGFFHVSRNLPADIEFLHAVVDAGVSRLIVAGTCLEYGMQFGPLSEELETRPTTPYGFAKDALRKALQLLQKEKAFTLQWVRLFYMYGDGQNPRSLLGQLNAAIDENRAVFDMSQGDQLRDYLPVTQVATDFVRILQDSRCHGVINCCSGDPIAVADLVSRWCRARSSKIELNKGHHPYPDYEPLAFWGVPTKLSGLERLPV